MRLAGRIVCLTGLVVATVARGVDATTFAKNCTVSPLGEGIDDTPQVLAAIEECGHDGLTTFTPGAYNITNKMTWDLQNSRVDLHGFLTFPPDIDFWLNANNTYRVIFIQSQASWFVITGENFTVDAHNTGGINGNGQPWWSFFANRTRDDGDGRPVALTLSNVTHGRISNFQIQAQPFWCNAVADSVDVVYDGMLCNATNSDPAGFGTNIVPNTDGIDTYRSDRVTMVNWDITCGDDCLAIKGNSTNLIAQNITCHGGNGIAFGSLGQYVGLNDLVINVTMNDVKTLRINSTIQPNMQSGAYFKSWTGTVNGVPPVNGGGGGGLVQNVTLSNFFLDQVDVPTLISQNNSGHAGDAPSTLEFSNITWSNWTGTSTGATLVELTCSSAAPCPNMFFENFNVTVPSDATPAFTCSNVINEEGLPSAACGNSSSS
ncbi:pectin lyase-like protein [Stereum hirsutum FP-91666 SS1]|uniref:pectin lyase-like protein n=1 Tax=Stereum hirsutum (strain FP-91666) TaxID=721885 RepID=UPI000440DD1A|nr:pectin lyase-like protein [Stereum hirsutum FP-91666 SS1]EIM87376.1 pectin lyase-like protein [Stereum hirsutum FP-91666 SS1]